MAAIRRSSCCSVVPELSRYSSTEQVASFLLMSFTGGKGGHFRHGVLEGSVGSTKTENFSWVLLYMAQMWSSLFPFACFMSHNCAAMKHKLKD